MEKVRLRSGRWPGLGLAPIPPRKGSSDVKLKTQAKDSEETNFIFFYLDAMLNAFPSHAKPKYMQTRHEHPQSIQRQFTVP